MGWWHGHLLKDDIRETVNRWRDALFLATVGVPYEKRQHAAAGALRETVEFYVDQCQHRMQEDLLQEYDGLAAGCGLSVFELVELEVLRDVLRKRGMEARLPGAIGATVDGAGMQVQVWWAGRDAPFWGERMLVIQRTPDDGVPHTVVTWPGGLGAMAGVRSDGLAIVCAELDVQDDHRRGFAGGLPFALVMRRQLATAKVFRDLTGVTGTMGHCVMSADGRTRNAVGSVETSTAGREVPQFLGDVRFLAVGPYERLPGPQADALLAAVNEPGLDVEVRFAQVRRHADGDPKSDRAGPSMALRWDPAGRPTLRVRRAKDAAPVELTLGQ